MRQEDRMMAAMGCVDWELVEGAAAPAGRRRLPRRARVGLIAACLCLVLAGTVWALEAVLGVRLGQTRSGYDDSGYSVQGEFQQFDLTQFGQALQDDLARGALQWAHDSWQSAADYVLVCQSLTVNTDYLHTTKPIKKSLRTLTAPSFLRNLCS